jgi:hypothetical protein
MLTAFLENTHRKVNNFNVAVRQYWSYAENFLSLKQDGKLTDYENYNTNKDSSFTPGTCFLFLVVLLGEFLFL